MIDEQAPPTDDAMDDDSLPSDVPRARPVGLPVARAASHPIFLLNEPRLKSIGDLLIVSGAAVGLWTLLQVLVGSSLEEVTVGDPRKVNLAATLTVALVVVSVTMMVARRGNPAWARSLGLCRGQWWSTIGMGLIAMAGAYVAMLLTQVVVMLFFPSALPTLARNQEQIVETFPKLHPAWLVVLALTVGFYEETVFRGFLLTRLRRVTGSSAAAVVFSSAVFAAVHLGSQAAIATAPLFVMGVFWSVLTLWRRSVLPAMIGHALFDLFNLVFLFHFHPASR